MRIEGFPSYEDTGEDETFFGCPGTKSTFGSTFATFASGKASATASYMAQTEVD